MATDLRFTALTTDLLDQLWPTIREDDGMELAAAGITGENRYSLLDEPDVTIVAVLGDQPVAIFGHVRHPAGIFYSLITCHGITKIPISLTRETRNYVGRTIEQYPDRRHFVLCGTWYDKSLRWLGLLGFTVTGDVVESNGYELALLERPTPSQFINNQNVRKTFDGIRSGGFFR